MIMRLLQKAIKSNLSSKVSRGVQISNNQEDRRKEYLRHQAKGSLLYKTISSNQKIITNKQVLAYGAKPFLIPETLLHYRARDKLIRHIL